MAPLPGATEARESRSSETLRRSVISVHGRDVDITDSGIDLEFLQALPDDMRADVVEQHLREQNRHHRSPSAALPESTSVINPEFLDALPPEIRAEVILQEAMESVRRARATSRDQPRAAHSTERTFDSLADDQRDVMLLREPRERSAPFAHVFLPGETKANGGGDSVNLKRSPRKSARLLDKTGIASLVRLLFFPEALRDGILFRLLVNLCHNDETRFDLLNLLLSVVQDGSGDLPAVDRSFQRLSLRAPTMTKVTPKARAADSPVAIDAGLFAQLQSEHVPTFIAHRCFDALTYIVGADTRAVKYFLIEQDQAVGLKKPSSKKGKGKDKHMPQTKFPIVILLGLLDRPFLIKSPGMMESLTSLLATITKPLSTLCHLDKTVQIQNANTDHSVAIGGPTDTTQSNDSAGPTQERTSSDVPVATVPFGLINAPIIPPSTLSLIVNCLTIGDCPSRTFSQTLAVMRNFSCMLEAKDVILQELRRRSHDLGLVIQQELRELGAALENDMADLGSLTLKRFSLPSASQAQLLRLLKTIEYLYLNRTESDRAAALFSAEERLVGQIYESFDFDPMWQQLGHCLSLLRDPGRTEQMAMLLLPLVEALMVVCKYRGRAAREIRSPSLPPSIVSESEDLFVSFTTAHRKILNGIVRNNPALLSGSFSLLTRNPRALEFDNKRNWFFQKLKRRRDQAIPTDVLPLNIRRRYVFEDSFHALRQRSGDEVKYGRLHIKFYNEEGIDAGGVTREWYTVLAQQIFDPNFGKCILAHSLDPVLIMFSAF